MNSPKDQVYYHFQRRAQKAIYGQTSKRVRYGVQSRTRWPAWSLVSFDMRLIIDEIQDQVPPR